MTGWKQGTVVRIMNPPVDGRIIMEEKEINVNFADKSTLKQKIISIAKILMETHYTLDTHTLFLKSVRILNGVEKRLIEDTINDLLKSKILFHGKALAKDDILENKTRKLIWTIILDLPGINFSNLKRLANKGSGEIEWHLYILQRYGFIRFRSINEKKCCYNYYSNSNLDDIFFLLHQSKILDIWTLVERFPEIKIKKLEKQLNIPSTTLFNKIHLMINAGILSMETESNNSIVLNICPKYREEIMKFHMKFSEYDKQLAISTH